MKPLGFNINHNPTTFFLEIIAKDCFYWNLINNVIEVIPYCKDYCIVNINTCNERKELISQECLKTFCDLVQEGIFVWEEEQNENFR